MNLEDFFPKTKFVKNFDVTRQIDVVLGELCEVEEGYKNNTNAPEEVIDVMHSAMQILYIMGITSEQVQELSKNVVKKNTDRGYYNV